MVLRESMSLFDRFKGLKARRFPFLYKAYGGEDLILAQTGYMAEHVLPSLPLRSQSKLRTLPNPVDYARIQTAAAESLEPELAGRLGGRANVLFCGRLVDFKRPAVALEAFRIATADQADSQLVFLGAGPLEQELRQLVDGAGMSDRVLFLGNRSNPYPVMRSCRYGIVTSANEGFPNVAVEMMACGMRRIVMTPCAGDLDQLTGVTVTRTFETTEIAKALRSAIESEQDCGTTYRKVAAARSVSAYLDALLSLS
jgi:glycosyltransferase involved in cell wall biosynthesis